MFNHLQNLTFRQAGIGSSLFHRYVQKDLPNLNWIHAYPGEVHFTAFGQERLNGFPEDRRKVLVDALLNQYKAANILDASVEDSLKHLASPETLTVTTGHQLGFAGGPLFLLHKIASVVALARQLNQQNPNIRVVPIFWLNSDDHDLEEIKSFFWQNRHWSLPVEDNHGPVGEYLCPEMPDFWTQLRLAMPHGKAWEDAFYEMKMAYEPGLPLGLAFRRLIATWTKGSGLICLDQQDPHLKRAAWANLSTCLADTRWHDGFLASTHEQEQAGFEPQVKPMPNLFFFHSSVGRERIEPLGQNFVAHQTRATWTLTELQAQMRTEPHLFSTNVTGRSLYQEFILPNMAYLGGAAELRYWMQFSGMFRDLNRPFPLLIPRESFLFLGQKELRFLNQTKVEIQELIGNKEKNMAQWVHTHLDNFPEQPWNEVLDTESMKWAKAFALQDASLQKAVLARYAELKKELKSLNAKRLKALKQQELKAVLRLEHLFDWIQPNGIFQERIQHPWLLGPEVNKSFQQLLAHSNPLQNQVVVLSF